MIVAMHVDGASIRGNERQALLIAAGLVGRGHRVVVSCPTGGEVEASMRVPTTSPGEPTSPRSWRPRTCWYSPAAARG